nr:MAG TPA: hypothetical protein [Caudoviricetes sp.]
MILDKQVGRQPLSAKKNKCKQHFKRCLIAVHNL